VSGFTDPVGRPSFYVARDDARREIVVAVRGTVSLDDFIVDFSCANVPFAGGEAHRGLLAAARNTLDACAGLLRRLLSAGARPDGAAPDDTAPDDAPSAARDPLLSGALGAGGRRPTPGRPRPGPMAPGSCAGYSVLLTGHSLGAGVAVLASMLIDRGGAGDIDARDFALPVGTVVRCDAFAPPPVFTPLQAVSASIDRQVRVVVNAFDLIPRLSVWSAVRLCEDMARVHDLVADRTVLGRILLIWRPLWFPGARAAWRAFVAALEHDRAGPGWDAVRARSAPRRGGLRRGESWIRMADRAATKEAPPADGGASLAATDAGPVDGTAARDGTARAPRRSSAFGSVRRTSSVVLTNLRRAQSSVAHRLFIPGGRILIIFDDANDGQGAGGALGAPALNRTRSAWWPAAWPVAWWPGRPPCRLHEVPADSPTLSRIFLLQGFLTAHLPSAYLLMFTHAHACALERQRRLGAAAAGAGRRG
jgi:hypothetical protein